MIIDFVLIVFFTICGILIGWMVMKSNYTLSTICVAIVLAILATGTYWSIQTFRGFPTRDEFGTNKYLLWGDIDPPREGYAGRIYLWMYDPDRESTKIEDVLKLDYSKQPRAFSIPYTEENARELRKALEEIRKGSGVVVEIEDGDPKRNVDNPSPLRLRMKMLDPYQIIKKEVDKP